METLRCIGFHIPSAAVEDFQSSLYSRPAYNELLRSAAATYFTVPASSYCNLESDRLSCLSFNVIDTLDEERRYAVRRKCHRTSNLESFAPLQSYGLNPSA